MIVWVSSLSGGAFSSHLICPSSRSGRFRTYSLRRGPHRSACFRHCLSRADHVGATSSPRDGADSRGYCGVSVSLRATRAQIERDRSRDRSSEEKPPTCVRSGCIGNGFADARFCRLNMRYTNGRGVDVVLNSLAGASRKEALRSARLTDDSWDRQRAICSKRRRFPSRLSAFALLSSPSDLPAVMGSHDAIKRAAEQFLPRARRGKFTSIRRTTFVRSRRHRRLSV